MKRWIKDDYKLENPTQLSKEELLNLIDTIIERIESPDKEKPNPSHCGQKKNDASQKAPKSKY